jgi:hypothetical protein
MSIPIFVALGAFALFFLRKLFTLVQNYRFAKAYGCQEAPQMPQSERIIGYGNYKQQVKMFKAKKILPEGLQRFEDVGDTYSVVTMGRKLIITREPENVKAILATNFKDFGIGRRFNAMGALLGQGIFTSDGALWEHSRVRDSVARRMNTS